MDPQIVNQMYDGDFMKFTLMGVDTSVANALRRTIISDIPTIVIRGFPHEKNKVNIDVNTTKLNNEIIKHRLSCIPIHIDDPNTFIETSYQLELDIKNKIKSRMYNNSEGFFFLDGVLELKSIYNIDTLYITSVGQELPIAVATNDISGIHIKSGSLKIPWSIKIPMINISPKIKSFQLWGYSSANHERIKIGQNFELDHAKINKENFS